MRRNDPTCDDGVLVEWKDVGKAPVFAEAMKVLERAHGDRATLIPNPMWRLLPPGMGQVLEGGDAGGAVLTVHPLGGCAMAAKAEKGVVNAIGQVFKGAADVMCIQRSWCWTARWCRPRSAPIPALTIAALAEHAVESSRRSGRCGARTTIPGRSPGCPSCRNRTGRIRRNGPRRDRPRCGSPSDLPESLKFDGQNFDAKLELEYRELPDLERFLSSPSKVLPIDKARLELRGTLGNEEVEATLRLTGELRVFEREATTVFDRVWSAPAAPGGRIAASASCVPR